MEYSMLNNSLGSLAFEPFCLDKDNLYGEVNAYTDELISGHSLYFNGYNNNNNTSGDVGNLNPTKVVNNESSLFDDIDIDVFTNINKPYSLDYLLEDGTMAQQGSDHLLFGGGITTPLGSPISSLSQDDLSYELLESIDIDEKRSSIKDILFFRDMDTPNNSMEEMSFEFTDLLSTADAVPPLSKTKNFILTEHMYAKTPESDNESFDTSSLKSVDSGISACYDETNDLPDDFISEQWNAPNTHNRNSLLETTSRDEHIDFAVNRQSASSKELILNVPDETDNATHTHRYLPYKGKQKTVAQKLRKKEHNRKSAAKYRSKKKHEVGTVFSEVDKLEEKNKELKVTVDEIRKEIDYLKSLMLDVINARISKKIDLNLGSLIRGLMSETH